MNWKLILALALFGVAMGAASVLGFTHGIEWVLWLIVFIVSAWIIATKAPAKQFLHGFFVGLLNGIVHSIIQAVFFETYLANNAHLAQQFNNLPAGMPAALFVLLSGPFIGVVSGVVLGLFAFGAGKIVRKTSVAQGGEKP